MPIKLSILAVCISIMFFLGNLIATEDRQAPNRNIPLLNFQKERLTQDSSESFWKRLFHTNESIVGLRYLNETLHHNSDVDTITDNEEIYENTVKNINRKTLIDYNSPAIMGDLYSRSDQDLTNHVRVKRNGLITNGSIISHQRNHSIGLIDSFPQNLWSILDTINTSRENDKINDSISKYKDLNMDHRNRSNALCCSTAVNILQSRYKRGILSNTEERRKRVKGSNRHSRHHTKTQVRNKKQKSLKSSHKPIMKEGNKKSKKSGAQVSITSVDKSRIKKRKSENSGLNTIYCKNVRDFLSSKEDASLSTNGSNEQRGNTIALPFVRTGKAELCVRIEKIITNKTSFTKPDNWINRSTEISSYSTTLSNYEAVNEITETTISNLEATMYFDSTKHKEGCNLTMEIVFKKLDGRSDSNKKTDDSENALFYNTELYPVESHLKISEDQNSENDNYDHTNNMSVELSGEDTKSRAKRNQEVASKRPRNDDTNTKEGFKHTVRGISVVDRKQKDAKYGNCGVRSIEEIKKLAEKLITKVNELQMYVSKNNKTVYVVDSCIDKKADRGTSVKGPEISLVKHVLSSKIAKNVDSLTKNSEQTSLMGRRTSLVSSSGSKFPRGASRTRKKPQRKWGRWMDWSSCSVTCGKGRQIRWRHCLRDCDDAETEMEEKACQFPACPPGKFLGIF